MLSARPQPVRRYGVAYESTAAQKPRRGTGDRSEPTGAAWIVTARHVRAVSDGAGTAIHRYTELQSGMNGGEPLTRIDAKRRRPVVSVCDGVGTEINATQETSERRRWRSARSVGSTPRVTTGTVPYM